MSITVKTVRQPQPDHSGEKVFLTDKTFALRKERLLKLMATHDYSSLVIYGDKEHGGSFEYLTGFIPRFEEGLVILNKNGESVLLLGNENANKVPFSRTASRGIKCPLFSLANQPMDFAIPMSDYLKEAQIDNSQKVGLVGWKLLSPSITDEHQGFDVPEFIVSALKEVVGANKLFNGTHLLIDAGQGARTINTANELAFYEYGASLASDGVLAAMNQLEVGVKETDVGDTINKNGQYNTVVTIAAFGDRFVNANIYPTEKTLSAGDKVALTVAYKGGLSSRVGYAVKNEAELEAVDAGYLTKVVKPYYQAYCQWLEMIKIGKDAGEFYQEFNEFYPQSQFGWELCPGHLVADEEWLSSPFYAGSTAKVRSGMIFQLDFIPIQPGHQGVSAESTLAIADEALRDELKRSYPALWERITERRRYMESELNIVLSEEILPLCSTLGYLRPFLLDKTQALAKK